MIAWLATAALAADWCSVRVGVITFEEAVARAELGVHALDAAEVGAALAEADLALPCVDAVLGVDPVARYYRASAIQRLVSGEEDAAVALFRGARALQPAFKLDPALAPPIRDAWEEAEPDPRTEPLPPASSGTWIVEGRPASAVPAGRPAVVQWLGDDGGVRATVLLLPGQEVPFGADARAPAPLTAPIPVVTAARMAAPVAPNVREGHPSRALAIAALGAAVTAGAGIASAAAIQEEVLSSPKPSEDLSGLVVVNRIVGYGAGGVAAVAVGLGAGAVVVGRW